MAKSMNMHNLKQGDRFWEAYRGAAEENRVRPDRSPFYVKWAKEFARFLLCVSPPKSIPLSLTLKDLSSLKSQIPPRHSTSLWP